MILRSPRERLSTPSEVPSGLEMLSVGVKVGAELRPFAGDRKGTETAIAVVVAPWWRKALAWWRTLRPIRYKRGSRIRGEWPPPPEPLFYRAFGLTVEEAQKALEKFRAKYPRR